MTLVTTIPIGGSQGSSGKHLTLTVSPPPEGVGTVPRTFGVNVRFTLSRPAKVALRIETRLGTIVKTLPPAQLPAGEQLLKWDAHLTKKTKAFPGTYVARVLATSEIGTMDLAAPFALRK